MPRFSHEFTLIKTLLDTSVFGMGRDVGNLWHPCLIDINRNQQTIIEILTILEDYKLIILNTLRFCTNRIWTSPINFGNCYTESFENINY
jgi:hypothetical protein